MSKLVIVSPDVYTRTSDDVLLQSFVPDVTKVLYTEATTPEEVLALGSFSKVAFLYHYPGYESLPFFLDKKDDVEEGTYVQPKYKYFSDKVIELFKSLRDAYTGSEQFVVDVLTCDLNSQSYKDEVALIEAELNINIRYSVDKTGNPPVGANWVLESDNVNVRDVYFTETVLSWSGVLTSDIASLIKNGTLSDFITFSNGKYTVAKDFTWAELTDLGLGITNTSFIQLLEDEVFDGNNKEINLQAITGWPGLLSTGGTSLENASVIKNLGVLGGTTALNGAFIIRQQRPFFKVENCYSTGTIGSFSGGISGWRSGFNSGSCTITNCYSTGNITSTSSGGMVGSSAGSTLGSCTITNCYSTGAINGGGIAGSFAGSGGSCTITNCYSTGEFLNNTQTGIGGIAGSSAGNSGSCTITNCYSTCAITTGLTRGGIVGNSAGSTSGSCTITNCVSNTPVIGGGSAVVTNNSTNLGDIDNTFPSVWDNTVWAIGGTVDGVVGFPNINLPILLVFRSSLWKSSSYAIATDSAKFSNIILSVSIPELITVNIPTYVSIQIVAGDFEDVNSRIHFTLPDGVTIEYVETDGTFQQLNNGIFGPSEGFPLSDKKLPFRILASNITVSTIQVSIKDMNDNVLISNSIAIDVKQATSLFTTIFDTTPIGEIINVNVSNFFVNRLELRGSDDFDIIPVTEFSLGVTSEVFDILNGNIVSTSTFNISQQYNAIVTVSANSSIIVGTSEPVISTNTFERSITITPVINKTQTKVELEAREYTVNILFTNGFSIIELIALGYSIQELINGNIPISQLASTVASTDLSNFNLTYPILNPSGGGPENTIDTNLRRLRVDGSNNAIDNQLNIKDFDTGIINTASLGIVNLTNNLILRVKPGQTYTLNVQAGNISGTSVFTSSIHVWIDWDRNGTFENTSERIAAENANNSMETSIIRQPNIISFTVPSNIQINTVTRMRVMVVEEPIDPNRTATSIFSWGSIHDFGIVFEYPFQYKAQDFKDVGVTAKDLYDDGVTVNDLLLLGFTSQDFKDVGVTAKDLYDDGVTANNLILLGFTLQDLKDAGVSVSELGNQFTYQELLLVGYSTTDLLEYPLPIIEGLGQFTGNVLASAYDSNGNLYIGGSFTSINGITVNRIARWSPASQTWSSLGSGVNNQVNAIAIDSNNNVYVGGTFTSAGGITGRNRIALWNGTSWSALGTGLGNTGDTVNAIAIDSNNNVYVGGTFTSAGGTSNINRIARWNGTSWSGLAGGVGNTVNAIAIDSNNNVYVGGSFFTVNNNSVSRIAKWSPDSETWSVLLGTNGNGVGNTVNAIAIDSNNNVYVGGTFTSAGGTSGRNRIALWNGTSWSELGSGLGNTVNAIALYNNNVYVGGTFTTAGGNTANRIARWNGTSWSAIGNGYSTTVRTISVRNMNPGLYVGGDTALSSNIYKEISGAEVPTDIFLSKTVFRENKPTGSVIAKIYTVDPNLPFDSHSYELINSSGAFAIDGDTLITNKMFDFETDPTEYTITISTTDSTGLSINKEFTLTLTDVAEIFVRCNGSVEGTKIITQEIFNSWINPNDQIINISETNIVFAHNLNIEIPEYFKILIDNSENNKVTIDGGNNKFVFKHIIKNEFTGLIQPVSDNLEYDIKNIGLDGSEHSAILTGSSGWLLTNVNYFTNIFTAGNIINIDNCYSTGAISFNSGGIAGSNTGSNIGSCTITNCYSTGAISGTSAGGITGATAGSNQGSCTITNCYSTGAISFGAGGIAGTSTGSNQGSCTITNCYSTGAISGSSAGGITGVSAGTSSGSCTITNCYSTGAISGSSTGGIVGNSAGTLSGSCTITNCYSTGAISGSSAGGITGPFSGDTNNPIIINNCVSNTPTVGTSSVFTNNGNSTQLADINNIFPSVWDNTVWTVGGSVEGVVNFPNGISLPILRVFKSSPWISNYYLKAIDFAELYSLENTINNLIIDNNILNEINTQVGNIKNQLITASNVVNITNLGLPSNNPNIRQIRKAVLNDIFSQSSNVPIRATASVLNIPLFRPDINLLLIKDIPEVNGRNTLSISESFHISEPPAGEIDFVINDTTYTITVSEDKNTYTYDGQGYEIGDSLVINNVKFIFGSITATVNEPYSLPITVNLNVNVDANGEIVVFGKDAPQLQNVIYAETKIPASAFWSSDNSAGLVEFWEPSNDLGHIAAAYSEVSKDTKAQAIAQGLQDVIIGGFDTRNPDDPTNPNKIATPFNDSKYATNAEEYRKHINFGRLALAAYAHYIFGHQAATAAITNDIAFMEKMMSLSNGSWTKDKADVLNTSEAGQEVTSAQDANIALRLAHAIATKRESNTQTGEGTSASGKFTNGDLIYIVKQVLGQDATRAMDEDNNELTPDRRQLLRFYPGDKIVVSITLDTPEITLSGNQNTGIVPSLYDTDKLESGIQKETYNLLITLS